MNGVLLIDKPREFTSFDAVAVVRKITGQKRVGHTGTLDPNATGVLVVLLGTATKAQDLILNHDKTYAADFKLGVVTDTLDIWGKIKQERQSLCVREDILNVLGGFVGEIEQIPPMFSAVQKNGRRLYDLARQGIEIERESRKVTVHGLELTQFDEKNQCGSIRVSCSKGTYIRTLIDDIGKKLGCGAVMTGLKRTSACGFDIDGCITLERAKELAERGELEQRLLSVESLFDRCRCVSVSDAQSRRFSNGGALDLCRTQLKGLDLKDGEIFRIRGRSDRFLGLGTVDLKQSMLKIYKLF